MRSEVRIQLISRSTRFAASLLLGLLVACGDSTDRSATGVAVFPLQVLGDIPDLTDTGVVLADKTLIINFWATWCEPCRREMPVLQQLSERLDPRRFVVVGISVDEDVNLAREFLIQHAIDFPVFQDRDLALARGKLGLTAFPQTFIVSPEGRIEQHVSRAISAREPWLDRLLHEQSGG